MSYKMLISVGVLLLVACNAKHVEPNEAHPPEAGKAHTAHAYTKPGARVHLIDNQIYLIQPGALTEISLRLQPTQSHGQMRVQLTSSEGLNIWGDVLEQDFVLAADRVYDLPLQVSTNQPGRYYVHINVSIDSEGRQMSRVISAIVQAGKDDSAKTSQKLNAARESGENDVITLPARETVVH